jgi:type I restriction enzyme M protein
VKRLSDRFDEEVESAVSTRGVPRETALSDPDEHEFFVPEDARWSVITGPG